MNMSEMDAGSLFPVFFFLLLVGTFTLFWVWSRIINRQNDDSED